MNSSAPSTTSPNEFSQRVKSAIDIGAFKPYLPDLKRKAGNSYLACCPLHNDSHPSMTVEFKKDAWVWYCHPCNKGGDLFTLVREKFGISFPEALDKVAADLNIQKTFTKFVHDPAAARIALSENTVALQGLAARGISPETATTAGIGLIQHPGIGTSLCIPYAGTDVVKIRALAPKNKSDKFRHLDGKASAHLLYGIEQLEDDVFDEFAEVHITESELDSLMMRQAGFVTLSVSSATTCINSDGTLKIIPEHMKHLERVEKVFLWFDQDDAGRKCVEAFERVLPQYKTFRVSWKYDGKHSNDPKDTGELYTRSPENFKQTINDLRDKALTRPPAWRGLFKSHSQMDTGDMRYLIKDFLPEGVSFFGALSGSGKTWFCLSMAKALTSGNPFLGRFPVPEKMNVVYLIPEAGERSFRGRIDRFGITDGKPQPRRPEDDTEPRQFLCRTMKDGNLKLSDPLFLQAIRDLKPVVFLDTAIRFSEADSENDARQTADGMSKAVFDLLGAGAIGVIGVHHAPKNAQGKVLTLENCLRGSGDFGAMSDAVYALNVLDKKTLHVEVKNVKARDFDPVEDFQMLGRPHIDDSGDFMLVKQIDEPVFSKQEREKKERFLDAITKNPMASFAQVAEILGMSRSSVQPIAIRTGWAKKEGEAWIETAQPSQPTKVLGQVLNPSTTIN